MTPDINALLRGISQYLRESSWGHSLSHKDCVKCGYADKLDEFLNTKTEEKNESND